MLTYTLLLGDKGVGREEGTLETHIRAGQGQDRGQTGSRGFKLKWSKRPRGTRLASTLVGKLASRQSGKAGLKRPGNCELWSARFAEVQLKYRV